MTLCFSVSFGSAEFVRNYSISCTAIPINTSYNDLGILFKSPLSFNNHIDKLVAKSFNKLALINKVFRNKNKYTVTKLYKAFIDRYLSMAL